MQHLLNLNNISIEPRQQLPWLDEYIGIIIMSDQPEELPQITLTELQHEYATLVSMIDLLDHGIGTCLKLQLTKLMATIGVYGIQNNSKIQSMMADISLSIKAVEFDLLCTRQERDSYKQKLDEYEN